MLTSVLSFNLILLDLFFCVFAVCLFLFFHRCAVCLTLFALISNRIYAEIYLSFYCIYLVFVNRAFVFIVYVR